VKTLAAVAAALAATAFACGGGKSETERLVRESVANMDELHSYRMEISWDIDGSYGSIFEFDGAVTHGREWLTPGPTHFDEIVANKVSYSRICETTCEPWHRTAVPTEDLLESRPETYPLSAATAVKGWRVVDEDPSVLHVAGRTTFDAAAKADVRRNGRAAGFSEDAIEEAAKGFDGGGDPMAVEVWIDKERSLITRINITGAEGEFEGFFQDAAFSDFNDVTVDVPTDFVESE
jgi:hypothetical protein